VSSQPSAWSNNGFENGLQGWTVTTLGTDGQGNADGSVETLCNTDDGFLQGPAGAPEGNCYAKLAGSQSITRDFPLEGPGCLTFSYAWDEPGFNFFYEYYGAYESMSVYYIKENGDTNSLVARTNSDGDMSTWQQASFSIPDDAVGSVLKFKGMVKNEGDYSWYYDSFLYLDNVVVTEDSCPG
jgi:hypothetical protein